MYRGFWLREVHLYVFYVSGRLSGGRVSNAVKKRSGSAKEDPHVRGGRGGGGGAGII